MKTALATGVGPAAASTYSAVAAVAAEYLAAKREGDAATLDRLTAPIWHGKRTTPSPGMALVGRAELLRTGPTSSEADYISNIQLCGGDFAVVRADRTKAPATTFLFIFKFAGWLVVADAETEAVHGERPEHFASRDAERRVLDVLESYYRAVTEGDPGGVRRIFASCWHMKNHEDRALLSEETDAFAARIEEGPLPTYWSDRHIADVQIAWNRIAYVRVDRPSTPSTTAFLFARESSGWKIIDKAWTDGRLAPL